jgi:hypothetical protein
MHTRRHPLLHLSPRPSRILAAAVGLLHGLAAATALLAPNAILAVGVLALVAASGWVAVRRLRHCGTPHAVRAIERDGAGRWWLETCAGERVEVVPGAPPVVTLALVVLYLTAGTRRWQVPLLPDSESPERLRRLRVILRTAED